MEGVRSQNHGYFEGVGRLRLHYRSWEVPAPRAALVLVHGLSDHSGRYAAFAETMADHGFSTFALDLRGHGYSAGRRGYVSRFDVFLQDLDRFRREVQGLIDVECPLFLLGHSMGGLIALRYLEEYDIPFRGAILVSPWLATAAPVPRWKVALAGMLNRALPAFPFSARINADDLCRDPQVAAAYRDDPLVHGRITPRLFFEVSEAMSLVLRRSERIRVPLLFLLAGEDRLVETQRSLMFARSLSGPDTTIRVLDGFYHEILNEPDRAPVLAGILDWMAERLP